MLRTPRRNTGKPGVTTGRSWVVMVTVVALASCANPQRNRVAVTLIRNEDNGLVNIQPADVRIDGRLVARISGGQTQRLFVVPGEHVLTAQSTNPYDPTSARESWVSA